MKIAQFYQKIEDIADARHKIINKEMKIRVFTIHHFY